jgi:hypothetical protein
MVRIGSTTLPAGRHALARMCAVLSMVVVVAIGTVGCGDGEDESRDGGANTDAAADSNGSDRANGDGTQTGDRGTDAADGAGDPGATARIDAERRRAVARTDALFTALRVVEPKRVCSLLTPQARREIVEVEGVPCDDYFGDFIRSMRQDGTAKRVAQARVGGVAIDGAKATVNLSFGGGESGVAALVRQNGAWRIQSFSTPAPLPESSP